LTGRQIDSQIARLRGRVRPIPGGPANVLRRDGVGGASEPAPDAFEPPSIRSIPTIYPPAQRAGLARIFRIDQHDPDALLLGLVLKECAQLTKRPEMEVAPLCPSDFDPGSDSLEILQGNPQARAFGLRDQILGDCMINMGSHPSFFETAFAQPPLGGFCPILLKPTSQSRLARAVPSKLARGVRMALQGVGDSLRIDRDPSQSQIHAQKVPGSSDRGFGDVHYLADKKIDTVPDKLGFTARSDCRSGTSLKRNSEAVEGDGTVALVAMLV